MSQAVGARADVVLITAAEGEDDAVLAVQASRVGDWEEVRELEGAPCLHWRGHFERGSGGLMSLVLARPLQMGGPFTVALATALVRHYRPSALGMCGVCAGRPGWTALGDVIIASNTWRYDVGEKLRDIAGAMPTINRETITYNISAPWLARAREHANAWSNAAKGSDNQETWPFGADWLEARPPEYESQALWLLQQLQSDQEPAQSAERVTHCPNWAEVVHQLRERGFIAGVGRDLTPAGRAYLETALFDGGGAIAKQAPWRVHVGPLATGNFLMRDCDIWKELNEANRLVLGLDMEAADLDLTAYVHDVKRTIVAKGVMDFAEPNRQRGFRPFAARAAAEVILRFLAENVEPQAMPVVGDAHVSEQRAQFLDIPRYTWDPELSPPGSLLRADHGVVPFHGRSNQMAELHDWATSDRRLAVRLVTGPGGMGKTRLALEFCRKLQDEAKWQAGFLRSRADNSPEDAAKALLTQRRPSLWVIDYAETRRVLLISLLREMLSSDKESGPYRVLLLARRREDWWEQLKSAPDRVGDLISGPVTSLHALAPLALSLSDRDETYATAARAFAKELGRLAPDGPPSNLDADHFKPVLMIHMSALAAVEGIELQGEDGILDWVLSRERRFWQRQVAARGLDAGLASGIGRAMAAITLGGGSLNEKAAVDLLARLPFFHGASHPVLHQVAELMHTTYPGKHWITPLLPDILGEHLIERELGADADEIYELVLGPTASDG